MRQLTFHLLLLAALVAVFATGCRDENDPEYWLDKMYDRPWREESLKNLNGIFSKTMEEHGNELQKPEVQELVNLLVPALIEGFNEFNRDVRNRSEIIKLLAQMKDERSVEVFMVGLELDETGDATMFQVSANAMRRQAVEAALPKLLAAHKSIVTARERRGGGTFTTTENEIEQSVISASVSIVHEHPNTAQKGEIVQMLRDITETSDLLQDLRLNMKAMKGLGRIGDAAAVPTLIKGIAMRGKRQPVSLGQIAFASLQQIHDRDVVVDGVLKFALRKDKGFNDYYKEEMTSDPAMKNPTWYVQQSTSFFGNLNYLSAQVLEFLEGELNHIDPDDIDTKAASIPGPMTLEAKDWAKMRRNWAAVALASMGYEPLLDVIVPRIKFKRKQIETPMEEVVGYIRSMGLLQYPGKSCKVMKKVATLGDDSLRDKAFYNAATMCGEDFLPAMEKAKKKIDCEKIIDLRFPEGGDEDQIKQAKNECTIMIKRIDGYINKVKFGQECGDDLDCYIKTIDEHTSSNVERAIYSAFRIAREDESKRDIVVAALIKNLNNPSKVALEAAIRSLDRLTPKGDPALISRIQEVYRNFARQSTYKDRARMLQSFIGRVRNRGRA